MGFRVDNYCYSLNAEALSAFNANFPFVTTYGNGASNLPNVVSLVSSSINTAGLITFTTRNQTGATVATNGTAQLPVCTNDILVAPDKAVLVMAFWFACLIGAICGIAFVQKNKVST